MTKQDLMEYRTLLLEVRQLEDKLRTLESSIYSPAGQRFTSTPQKPTGPRSTMDSAVEKHIQLVDLYEKALADKEAQQLKIEQAVQALHGSAVRFVIRARYIEGREWSEVCTVMRKRGYSDRTVFRLHGVGLAQLQEMKTETV